MSQQAQNIIKIIKPILLKHGVTKAELFGSLARGDNGPDSDVDVLVQMPPDSSLFDKGRLYLDLKDYLKKEIDLVSYQAVHPYIKDYVYQNTVHIL